MKWIVYLAVVVTGVLIFKYGLHGNPVFEKIIAGTFVLFGGTNIVVDYTRKQKLK